MNKQVFILLFLFGLTQCQNNHNSIIHIEAGLTEIDVLRGLERPIDFPLSTIIDSVSIVKLELSLDSWFSVIRGLDISENYILITSDAENKVLLFKRNGEFLRSIGRLGKGPGEFLAPWFASICPDESSIIIHDAQSTRIYKFSIDGELLKEVNAKDDFPTSCNSRPHFINNDLFAISYDRPYSQTNNHYNIGIYNTSLELVKKTCYKENNNNLCQFNIPFQQFFSGDDHLHYTESTSDTVYYLNNELETIPRYYLNIREKKPPISLLKGQNNSLSILDFNVLFGYLNTPKYLFFKLISEKKVHQLLLNKSSNELNSIENHALCLNPTGFIEPFQWNNDLFGYDNLTLSNHFESINCIVEPLNPEKLTEDEIKCIADSDVIFPQIRNAFLEHLRMDYANNGALLLFLYVKH